jgi:hypothetical protein
MKFFKSKQGKYIVGSSIIILLLTILFFVFKSKLKPLLKLIGLDKDSSQTDREYTNTQTKELDKIEKSIPITQLTKDLNHKLIADRLEQAMKGFGVNETPFYELKKSFTIADRTKIITSFGIRGNTPESLRTWIEAEYGLKVTIREGKSHEQWLKDYFLPTKIYN